MDEQPVTPLQVRIGRVLAAAQYLTKHMEEGNQAAANMYLKRLMLLSKELDAALERGDK